MEKKLVVFAFIWPILMLFGVKYLPFDFEEAVAQNAVTRPTPTVASDANVSKKQVDIIYLRNSKNNLTFFPDRDPSNHENASAVIDRETGRWDFKKGIWTDRLYSGDEGILTIENGEWKGKAIPADKLPSGTVDHNHDSAYAALSHSHPYAASSHTHSYSPISHGHTVTVTSFTNMTPTSCSSSGSMTVLSSCPSGQVPIGCNCRHKVGFSSEDVFSKACRIADSRCSLVVSENCSVYEEAGVQSLCIRGTLTSQ